MKRPPTGRTSRPEGLSSPWGGARHGVAGSPAAARSVASSGVDAAGRWRALPAEERERVGLVALQYRRTTGKPRDECLAYVLAAWDDGTGLEELWDRLAAEGTFAGGGAAGARAREAVEGIERYRAMRDLFASMAGMDGVG